MILFVAVSAAVNFLFFIGKDKDLILSVLDRCDAARILAFDHIDDLFWKVQLFLVYDLTVFDDVDGDIVVDKTKDIKIQHVNRTIYFNDIFFAHFVAAGIFDDGYTAVQLIQFQIMVDGHALSCFDVVENHTFVLLTYI